MLYNSLQFLLFFIIVTFSYFQLPYRFRWILLLLSSCYFYMAFVPRYIAILGFTIVIDYFAGILIEQSSERKRKLYLIASLAANISTLAVFKYYNFFIVNINDTLSTFNIDSSLPFINFLLPIGLSFHTFQAMSYTIEVYRGNQKAERHFGIYALYVMFYPQLVAGPIERPQNILHQFHENHSFDYERIKSGLLQMAFGLFKKVVIADRLALVVDPAYSIPSNHNGSTLLIATIFYSFQIYCDFSGYSDIGIGAARVMGYDLMENFHSPYESRTISEFWRRWHISLSTWFRDYLYIPLGGNRVKYARRLFNLLIIFLVSGFWHGANWTFIIWGALHGTYQIISVLTDRFIKPKPIHERSIIRQSLDILATFALVTFAWIFFRAPSLSSATSIISKIFDLSAYHAPEFTLNRIEILFCILLIAILLIKERIYPALKPKQDFQFYIIFTLIIVSCYLFGVFEKTQFIYFQF